MASRKSAARTSRRLLKVASLGIAGLVAGFLAGCSSNAVASSSHWSNEHSLQATRRLENLDYRRTPEFRHAPTPHHYFQPNRPQTHSSATAYAQVGEIDDLGHHYVVRSVSAQ